MATIEATNPTHLSATTMVADLAMEIIMEMWVATGLATPISQKATANRLAVLAVAAAAHSNTERTCKQYLY